MKIPEKYQIIRSISVNGNFGEVYLCRNKYLANRNEAVKIIPIKDKVEAKRLRELYNNLFESSVLQYLRKSKYIVSIFDAEIIKHGFRINMEYLKNGSVQDLLNKKDFLNIKQVLKISECVLHALEYSHNCGILHLDIKPSNILIENENIYKLSDFGLANIRDRDGLSTFKKIYTKHIPPEKLSKTQLAATEQSDIYMFGVTLYRLLNGDSFFFNQYSEIKNKLDYSIISGKFPNRKKYLPHIPRKIKMIVNKCLNINLGKRYKNVREIRNNLAKVRIIYDWVPKKITKSLYHWECFLNGKPFMELKGIKDENNLWILNLRKYGKTKKIRILKHCSKGLKRMEFNRKLNVIFNEFI